MLVGEHLAYHGRAGRWTQLDVPRFISEISWMEDTTMCVCLVAHLYAWLAFAQTLQPDVCRRMIRQLAAQGPQLPSLIHLLLSLEELVCDTEQQLKEAQDGVRN